MAFKDHFSDSSTHYARYRPTYPEELFTWLASVAPGREYAWDCATGNGQAAIPLAGLFEHVVATDGSEQQLVNAVAAPNVEYRVALAEDSALPANSVDLVTVAQALHWFDYERFYREVGRVGRDGAIVAAWTYSASHIEGPIGEVIRRYHDDVVGNWWPPERAHVVAGYASLPFPFQALEVPRLSIPFEVNVDELVGYLGTWSATRAYRRETGQNPTAQLTADFRRAWPPGRSRVALHMPLHILAGRVRREDHSAAL